jgi:predicted CoA-substrate-specific enzyme activase
LIIDDGTQPIDLVAEGALNEASQLAGIRISRIRQIGITGMAGKFIAGADRIFSHSVSIAKGACWLFPGTRTVLDIGAEVSMAVNCEQGRPTKFAKNDRCAAGTGSYLETVAKILELQIEDIGERSLQSTQDIVIASTCAVFAETEIVSLIHGKNRRKVEDILRGVCRGLVERLYSLTSGVEFKREVMLAGGVARNMGVIKALEERLGYQVIVPEHPEIVGALGAAVAVRE